MATMKRVTFWLVTSVLYWYGAYSLVGWLSPVLLDGSGPSATFYWGKAPNPTLSAYLTDEALRFKFLLPYLIAATVLTVLAY